MTAPIPGMPVRLGDPGVFVCGPGDVEPWGQDVPAAPRQHTLARPARRSGWLVLALCPACRSRRNYCADHDRSNFWLNVFGPAGRWRR